MSLAIREARPDDLEAIVRLHEEDAVGGHGDAWLPETRPAYEAAFASIAASSHVTLYVVESEGQVVGTFQLVMALSLTGRGQVKARLESVQVRADQRSKGIGAEMVAFAEREARDRGAAILQLTSNKSRAKAHRFYERLGYARTHEGFKKALV